MDNKYYTGISVKKATEFGECVRTPISEIFVDGFYQWLQFFSKDKLKLTLALKHMFNLDVFYVASVDGEISGIAACTNSKTLCLKLIFKELWHHLGFMRGMIMWLILRGQFEKHTYPFTQGGKTGSVEFVATASKYRGKGIASEIIRHFFLFPQYDEYVLEVADTNLKALELYEGLGFKEFKRIKIKNAKRSGINFLVYMKYTK